MTVKYSHGQKKFSFLPEYMVQIVFFIQFGYDLLAKSGNHKIPSRKHYYSVNGKGIFMSFQSAQCSRSSISKKSISSRAHFFCIVKVAKVNLCFCLSCCCYTVWKFHNFSVTHILREINFGEFRSSKNAVFAIFGSSEFG